MSQKWGVSGGKWGVGSEECLRKEKCLEDGNVMLKGDINPGTIITGLRNRGNCHEQELPQTT